jgi:hypothetical protein
VTISPRLTSTAGSRIFRQMGGLTRQPVPPATDDEIIAALARSSARTSVRAWRFKHASKSYIAYEGGIPALPPGTIVATSHAFSIVADGHRASADELATAIVAFEDRARSSDDGAR